MIIPTPYKPRNPELLRLTEDQDNMKTPKSSPRITTNKSPMPKNIIILGENAQKYLPTLPNEAKGVNPFGIYHISKTDEFMIGKYPIIFDFDDIILNGKKHILTPGMWRLLTHTDVTKSEFYTKEDFENYEKILIETDSIYQNNDINTGKPKSSGSAKYNEMIKPIWEKIKLTSTKTKESKPKTSKKDKSPTLKESQSLPKGEGLIKYTNNPIEFIYIDNIIKIIDRLYFILAEEIAGNYGFHNEKLGIVHLFKRNMETLIDTPKKGVEYLLQSLLNLPKETTNKLEYNIKQLIDRLHVISSAERSGKNTYHDEKLEILNFCIKKIEKIIDIPVKGVEYLMSYISHLPKDIIKGSGFFNDFLNCSKLPPIHWPGYNYLGPFTNLDENIPPINKLDEYAREHDYFYKDHKDTKTRHIADKNLQQKAMERFYASDSSLNEKIAALTTANVMKTKRYLGMNLIFE